MATRGQFNPRVVTRGIALLFLVLIVLGKIGPVDTTLSELIEQASSGNAETFQKLVRVLRADAVKAGTLVELMRSDHLAIRRAAIVASGGRTEPELLAALTDLANDPSKPVRKCLAEELAGAPGWPLDTAIDRLLRDDEEDVRQAATRAARGRPALEAALVVRLGQDGDWRVRRAAAEALAGGYSRAVLPALVVALAKDTDSDVWQTCAASIEKHLADLGGYPAELTRPRLADLEEAQRRVKSRGGTPRSDRLAR